jgi:hypothetical protein
MLSFNPFLLISLTLHMSSHLWWVHAHYFPQLVELWSFVCSPLQYITPHRRRTGGPGGVVLWGVRVDLGGVSQSALWRQGIILSSLYLLSFIFVRLPLCNNDIYDIVMFISIHFVIICDVLLWRTYEMHLALSLKSRCDTARGSPLHRSPASSPILPAGVLPVSSSYHLHQFQPAPATPNPRRPRLPRL